MATSLLEARERPGKAPFLVKYQPSLSSPQNHAVAPTSPSPTLLLAQKAHTNWHALLPLSHFFPGLQTHSAQTHRAWTHLRAFALAILSAQYSPKMSSWLHQMSVYLWPPDRGLPDPPVTLSPHPSTFSSQYTGTSSRAWMGLSCSETWNGGGSDRKWQVQGRCPLASRLNLEPRQWGPGSPALPEPCQGVGGGRGCCSSVC